MNNSLIRAILLLFLVLPAQAAPLSGTKSIGPTGDYASLTAAITDIKTQTLGGALVLELQAAYVSTVETFPLVFTNLTTTVTNTLTLRPAAGATNLSISTFNNTRATVDLDGAQFVTIDGRPGGAGTAKQLTIANTNTSGIALRFINESSNNLLQYLTFRGVNTGAFEGTVVFGDTTGPSGNDNNTITFCDICDGASTPANGIYAEGTGTTTEQNNSGNAITNCNVFNFYRSTAVDASGMFITSGNTGWTISGNSFYQTASRAGVAATVRAIHLSNTSNNSHTVTGNFIGGTAPNAGGTPWTTTGTTQPYIFVGIWLRVGNSVATSVQGNTIRNFVWNTSSNATTQPGVWSGIHVETGAANIGTVTGNTVGSGSGTGSVSVVTSGSGGMTFGIGSGSSQPGTISNNTIGSINASGTSTGISASITGIQNTRGTRTISGNLVGSTTTGNSLNASTTVSTGTQQRVAGIECANAGSLSNATITGNTVANLRNNSTQTNAMMRGIVTSVGVNTISGNTVRNLTCPSMSTGPSVVGIWAGSSSDGQTVSGNIVHSLSNLSNTAIIPPKNVAVAVAGIYFAGGSNGPNIIERNLVHSLSLDSENPSAVLSGLLFPSAGTFTVQNNLVRVGLDATGASTAGGATVIGLHDDNNGASNPRNFIHNSVYVGGTATIGAANSFAYSSSSQHNLRDIRNNIFFNARSNNGGTGKHYAMANGSVTSPPPGLTSDHNIVYVTGNGGVLGRFNGANYSSLAAWQAVTGLDLSSAAVDPRFVNATGNSATVDLHLQATNPAEGRGVPVATVTNDFDGGTRSSLTPVDIGADAGNFTYDPSPTISYPLLSNGTTANRTLTGWATILDDGGNPVSGGASAPRLYYKKATDADAFVGNTAADNGWKYVTATNGSSPYSFTVDYSLIQGGIVTIGETIQYFVVAQDTANNLSSSPAAASASVNPPVQNINSKPRTGINSYNIVATVGGTVTVGSGGNYSSLSGSGGLFAALNAGALTGDLTVNLTSNTTETGSVQLNATSSNSHPPFTVTIRPNSATMRTISGSAANGLIRLNGVQRVTFDGRFGGSGRYLTFRNTSTDSLASTLIFINDASNNTVRNCVFEGMNSTFGVVSFRTGVLTGNDNNTVTENHIRDRSDAAGVPGYLIVSGGGSDGIANSSNVISNNELFNFLFTGIAVSEGSNSWTITGNTIYQTAARTSALTGISLDCLGTNSIHGNTIRDLTTTSQTVGIKLSDYTGSTTVAGNRLWNLGNRPGSTNYARGIYCEHVSNQSVTLVNNMITLGSSGTTSQNLSGIYDDGTTDSTTNILFNTVLLTGTGGTSRDTWAYVYGGKSTATVKNNIFLNLRTGGGNHFAANYPTSSTGTLAMDYNVYSGTGLATAANFFGSSDITGTITGTPISYAQWKTNVPSDIHSSASTPGGNYSSAMFVAPATGDLHLVLGGNVLVNNKATPIAGVTDDFDGETRHSVAPMIGADEYLVPEIIVRQINALTDGTSTVDFGTVETGGSSAIKTFTITNPGTAPLTDLAITTDGTNANAFSISALSSTEIPPGGGNATFTVTFSPTLVGPNTAALHLASNLTGAINPFDIALAGAGTSTNADLSELTISSGTLNPGFSNNATTYTASVSNATASITVTPTRAQANATIEARINGGGYSPVTSGSPSGSLALNVGSNTIDIRVTAYAGNTKTYTTTVTRDKAVQTITFPNPGDQLASSTVPLSATGGGSGNPVTFAVTNGPASILGGNQLTFTGAGSVTIIASQSGNTNFYDATPVVRTFAVTKATATVSLTGLAQTFNGSPRLAGATTNPLGKSVTFTYDSSPTAPTNAGSYAVVGTINDPIYQGSASGTLVVAKAEQTITFPNPGDQLATATVLLPATGGGSGNPVTFAVTNGPGSIHGGNQLTFTGAGSVTITASQSGSANYHDAAPVARTFNVTKAGTTVTLRELHQVADGTPRVVTVTTVPPGLGVAITYAGGPDAPTAIGSYAVIATINDPLYEGSANGTLVVDDPAAMTRIEGGPLPAVSALGVLDVPTYEIARYEVTRGFWNTVRDWAIANGYDLAVIGEGSVDDHPVHSLNWYDAIKWCNARTEWENATFGRSLAPVYWIGTAVFRAGEPDPATLVVDERTSGYRLPTAVEWEFAARGGTSSTGKSYAGGNDPDLVAWHAGNSAGAVVGLSGGRGTWPAGRKAANELGLYDFSGNLAEWTQQANPATPATRYLLGGSWNAAASESTIGFLNSGAPSSRLNTNGLRVSRSVASAMAGALDNDGLIWNSGGDAVWFAQTGTTHDTSDAAESGALGEGDETWIETTVTGPGDLSFRWKSTSVDGVDTLRFSIGASETESLTGTVDWQERTFEIPAGESVLRWRFARTSPANAGTSRVWLDQVVYTLLTEPEVTTAPATDVTETTATLGGEATDDGGRAVTARGVVYDTMPAPTLTEDSAASDPTGGTGVFTVAVTNLVPGTTYHARAYATNAIGTGYGPEIVFTTDTNVTFSNGVADFSRNLLPGDRQVFHFTLGSPRIVSLSTLGGTNLRAALYDSAGSVITSFSGDTDFALEELLLAGDYEFHVFREANSAHAPAFDLTIDASVEALSRPDLAVGASAVALTGGSVFSPVRQSVGLTSRRLIPVTGHATVANRGKLPDVLILRGSGRNPLFGVSYFGPDGNITAGLLAGTFATPEMDENSDPVAIRATIMPIKNRLIQKAKGRKPTILRRTLVLSLRLSSAFDPDIDDTATISVQTR